MRKLVCLAVLGLVACGGGKQESTSGMTRGVTETAISIGSHTDLSGGLAIWGVPLTNGQRMRYEEANAAGGIHGRNIDFVVEDTQYQMPLAVKATNKLLNVDRIFLMVGSMGTPMNIALMPKMFEANVPSLFPLTAAVQMHEPLHPMKFNYFVSYRDQVIGGMKSMTDFSSSAVVGQASTQAPQLTHSESMKDSSWEAAITESKPRPSTVRAKVPWISSQARTQR
jgi:ABC-type branched-subunit amino acid transport system substrate-binding protein